MYLTSHKFLLRRNIFILIASFAMVVGAKTHTHADFRGEYGYTVVFAFSESTGKYGWGFDYNFNTAANTAVRGCGAFDARVVCYKKDGFLCLCWSGGKFAFGHNTTRAQNAVSLARESFERVHGHLPERYECRSSDGHFVAVE